jgi:DNA-binding response OmpR family regulator
LIRTAAKRTLERLGFEAVLAESGARAVALFEARHREIDAVLVDVSMPEMDGAECFERLRRIDESVPVIICTGHGDRDDIQAMVSAGASGVILKPFSMSELRKCFTDLARRQNGNRSGTTSRVTTKSTS